MKKLARIMMVISGCLCAVGIFLIGLGAMSGGMRYLSIADLDHFSADKNIKKIKTEYGIFYEEKKSGYHLDKKELHNISSVKAELKNLDFSVCQSPDEHYYLSYDVNAYQGKNPFSYKIKGETLFLKENYADDHGVVHIGAIFREENEAEKVTLYVPKQKKLDHFSMEMGDGDFSASDLTADEIEGRVKYGDAEWKTVTCQNMKIHSEDGDIQLEKLVIGKTGDISSKYGDIRMKSVNIEEEGMQFVFSTQYGDLEIADGIEGNKMEDANEENLRFQNEEKEVEKTLRVESIDGDIQVEK